MTNETTNHTSAAEDVLERLLTPTDVAEMLSVPEKTLAAWRSRRQGPLFVRIGVHVRYRRCDIDDWLSFLVDQGHRWMAS